MKTVFCESYDPLYGLLIDEKREKYDVIVLCEVIEHLRNLRMNCGL